MKIDRECPVCGVTYKAEVKRLEFGRQTTCSRACSYRLRASKIENSITLKCGTCGDEFKRPVSHVKGKHGANFCSPSCHYLGRAIGATIRVVTSPYKISEEGRAAWVKGAQKTRQLRIERGNYKHTEATKAKLSEKTAAAISSGRIGRVSKIEDVVAEELTRIGVSYVRQYAIRAKDGTFSCVFDFLIGGRIALEVQGTYWHADPRFFPDGPIHPIQKRNATKWAGKLVEAANHNIRVIEVWECDIKKNPTQAVRQAIDGALI